MGAIALELLTGSWNLIKMLFAAIGKFLSSLDAQGWIGLIICLPLAWVTIHEWGDARHWHKQSDRNELLYHREHIAFGLTVLNYRKTAAQAEAADKANVLRVKVQQDQISQERSDDYQTRLAAARAEYQRLLAASTSHLGGPAGTSVSGVSTPVTGPDEAASQDRLSDAFLCTAQSLQLDALEKWVTAEHNVNPNK